VATHFPKGTGAANSKGLAFYDRFLDELLANGIAPFPTLYHWDLPRALQDRGGWENRDTAEAFAHYAGYVAEKIQRSGKALFHAQRVLDVRRTRPCDGPVRARVEAAARRPEPAPPSRAARPRACGPSDPRAFARGHSNRARGERQRLCSCRRDPEHIAAAELATRELNAPYLTAMMKGRYRESFLTAAGVDAPKAAAGDMSVISTPVDFVGLKVYLPGSYVRARDDAPGFVVVPFPVKFPTMNSSWLKIGPEALYWGPRNVAKLWSVSDIYITENGCSATDMPAADKFAAT
jgi:beta-glucosidase